MGGPFFNGPAQHGIGHVLNHVYIRSPAHKWGSLRELVGRSMCRYPPKFLELSAQFSVTTVATRRLQSRGFNNDNIWTSGLDRFSESIPNNTNIRRGSPCCLHLKAVPSTSDQRFSIVNWCKTSHGRQNPSRPLRAATPAPLQHCCYPSQVYTGLVQQKEI